MKFEKKMIIVSGIADSSRGTVVIERNAFGVFCQLSAVLDDLDSGEYCIAVKSAQGVTARALGTLGKISCRFGIALDQLTGLHCIVFVHGADGDRPLMYGTNAPSALWAANMMDGVNLEIEKTTPQIAQTPPRPPAQIGQNSPLIYSTISDLERVTDSPESATEALPAAQTCAPDNQVGASVAPNPGVFDGVYDDTQIATVNYYTPAPATPAPVEPLHQRCLANFRAQVLPHILGASATQQQPVVRTLSTHRAPSDFAARYTATQAARYLEQRRVAPLREVAATRDVRVQSVSPSPAQPTSVPPPRANPSEVILEATRLRALTYYEQVREQVDQLFDTFPAETTLMHILPETRWIRVDYDNSGRYYVVGLIGARPDYICYGVPGEYSPTPPKELDGYCQWLPADEQNPTASGYWLMYQDATTGQSIQDI